MFALRSEVVTTVHAGDSAPSMRTFITRHDWPIPSSTSLGFKHEPRI
jgi:hypothetical protein